MPQKNPLGLAAPRIPGPNPLDDWYKQGGIAGSLGMTPAGEAMVDSSTAMQAALARGDIAGALEAGRSNPMLGIGTADIIGFPGAAGVAKGAGKALGRPKGTSDIVPLPERPKAPLEDQQRIADEYRAADPRAPGTARNEAAMMKRMRKIVDMVKSQLTGKEALDLAKRDFAAGNIDVENFKDLLATHGIPPAEHGAIIKELKPPTRDFMAERQGQLQAEGVQRAKAEEAKIDVAYQQLEAARTARQEAGTAMVQRLTATGPKAATPELRAERLARADLPYTNSQGYVVQELPGLSRGERIRLMTNPTNGATRVNLPTTAGSTEIPFANRLDALEFARKRVGVKMTYSQATGLADLQRQRLGIGMGAGADPFLQ